MMTRPEAWCWRAFLALWGTLWLVVIFTQMHHGGKAVQTVETWPTEIVDGSEAYYPRRDTSHLRYICCAVIR